MKKWEFNKNENSPDENTVFAEIFTATSNTGFNNTWESNITVNSAVDSAVNSAVNYIWVNPELVTLIRQKLRRRRTKNDFLDHYLYFCGVIAYLKNVDKRFDNHEFVPINYKTMSSIISRTYYTQIVNDLISWGIIEINQHYQSGNKSKGFKLLPLYDHNLKKRLIKDELINKKLNQYKIRTEKEVKNLPLPYKYLEMTNTWIKINYEQAITSNIKHYFSEPQMSVYDSNFYSLNAYKDEAYRFTVDTFANRAHTNLTNIKSDMRSFLHVDGKSLGQVDIKNSQPLFFYMHIKDNPDISEDEKMRYKQIVENGRFYEFFMDKLGIPANKRSDVKHKILAALFFDRNRTKESRYMRVFREEFPQITEYIIKIKSRDRKRLAQILQKAESKFVIEKTVAAFINKFGDNKEFISTIHDSIVVKSEMLQEAKQIFMESFLSEGINPQVEIVKF